MAIDRYVLDTCAIVCWARTVFNAEGNLSNPIRTLIDDVIAERHPAILHIPGVALVEAHYKFARTPEVTARMFYEVFYPLKNASRVDIREFDLDAASVYVTIPSFLPDGRPLESNDKMILSMAMVLEAKLVTSDRRLIDAASLPSVGISVVF